MNQNLALTVGFHQKNKKTLKTLMPTSIGNRKQGSFDCFKGVMNEVAELDQRALHNISNLFFFFFLLTFLLFIDCKPPPYAILGCD